MTMFTLPNFCRICLKYDKTLIDLEHIENEPNETLMSKLQQVSEVEWNVFKPLLCHPCIKRLNIAYTFKKQCTQAASLLKNYVALVESKTISDSQSNAATDSPQTNAYMMLPNQKYIKIVAAPVLVNVVPGAAPTADNNNQNVFLNINNTFQKFIPGEEQQDLNQLLTESTSEELSVEIDPTDFGLGALSDDDDDTVNDWEDVISAMKIAAKTNGNSKTDLAKASSFGNYVPILPKQTNDKSEDFSNSGEHFLSSQLFPTPEYACEKCQKQFSSKIALKYHVKNFHMGKTSFSCDVCANEFTTRGEYEACVRACTKYKNETSITLSDLKNGADEVLQEFTCDLCQREFNSASGLLRHKVRKHEEKTKKKYFIKGMKNAKCDICNREFSTQSYMQLHRKLHLRDDIGYKYKVFGRNRYEKPGDSDNQSNKVFRAKIKTIKEQNKQTEDESNSDNATEH